MRRALSLRAALHPIASIHHVAVAVQISVTLFFHADNTCDVARDRRLFGNYRDHAGFCWRYLETNSVAMRQLRMRRCKLRVWQMQKSYAELRGRRWQCSTPSSKICSRHHSEPGDKKAVKLVDFLIRKAAHLTSCPSPPTSSRVGSAALSPLLSRLRGTRKVVGCPNQTCAHNRRPRLWTAIGSRRMCCNFSGSGC